ncbi:hypothetical protein [Corallococcus macrosporus]|uniref:hypothetical protein n=1 Tax=Corallococcus macrosporus TaxID=35 RepID=UPI0012FD8675
MSKSITHAEVHRFIEEAIGTDTHAKRVLSLSNATLGTLHAVSLSVRAMGLALSQARGWRGNTPSSRWTGCWPTRGMKEAGFLAASRQEATATELVKSYGRRVTCEVTHEGTTQAWPLIDAIGGRAGCAVRLEFTSAPAALP